MNVDAKVDFSYFADETRLASGADIRAITQEAGMFAIRERRTVVTFDDFKLASRKVLSNRGDLFSIRNEYL